jgi:hypothetical protein
MWMMSSICLRMHPLFSRGRTTRDTILANQVCAIDELDYASVCWADNPFNCAQKSTLRVMVVGLSPLAIYNHTRCVSPHGSSASASPRRVRNAGVRNGAGGSVEFRLQMFSS